MTIVDSPFALLRHPSAWLPLALSSLAVAWLCGFLLFVPPPAAPPADEGIGARVFQLLLVLQLPIIGYFLLVWLPQQPAKALIVFALQVMGCVIALLPVYLLEI